MTRKSSLIIVLLLGFLVITLMNVEASAQRRRQAVADSGFIPLAANHKLIVTVATKFDNDTIQVRFRLCAAYGGGGVGIRTLMVNTVQISPIMPLSSDQVRSFEVTPNAMLEMARVRVYSDSLDMKVTMQIVNTTTGEVVTSYIDAVDQNGNVSNLSTQ